MAFSVMSEPKSAFSSANLLMIPSSSSFNLKSGPPNDFIVVFVVATVFLPRIVLLSSKISIIFIKTNSSPVFIPLSLAVIVSP